MSRPYWESINEKRLINKLIGGKKVSERTKEQINQEYGNTCAQIGERMFQISVMQAEIAKLNEKVYKLGEEMQVLNQGAKSNENQESAAS